MCSTAWSCRRPARRSPASAGSQRMRRREPRPRRVRLEERSYLLLARPRPRISAPQPPDQLQIREVTRRKLIEPSLPGKRKLGHGPAPDPRDRAQPSPPALVVRVVQVDAPGGNLAGGADERDRPRTRQAERFEPRRCLTRERLRARGIAHPAERAAASERRHQSPLDRRRPLGLDQLLADRPRQRLEWLRRAGRPQSGVGAHGPPDQGVGAEALVELTQVLVDSEREAHALDPPLRPPPIARLRAEQHAIA